MKILIITTTIFQFFSFALFGQIDDYGIKLNCSRSETHSGTGSSSSSVVFFESLGSYKIKWPESLKDKSYRRTVKIIVTLNSDGDIISRKLNQPLNNCLDSVALDIIDNTQLEFHRIARDGCIAPLNGFTYYVPLTFERK